MKSQPFTLSVGGIRSTIHVIYSEVGEKHYVMGLQWSRAVQLILLNASVDHFERLVGTERNF